MSVSKNRFPALVTVSSLALAAGLAMPMGADAQVQVSGFEEIVVKAQRRDERLVDIPISVSSVSEERLQAASLESLVSLPQMVPGMRFDYSGAYVQPTIRGVGSALAGPGLNSNVAVYFDGYYVPNALASDFQLLSVSSVNVLKGPQGTLFGRNATGGALLINTRDPSFEPTMTARASYARFNRANVSLYGSTGLTDELAVDITAFYEEGDGFIRNVNTGNKDGAFDKWSVRSKLLYTPNDNVKLTLAYAHTEVDDPMAFATSSYQGLSAGNVIPGVTVAQGRREVSNGAETSHRFKGDVVSLTGEFDLGSATLTSYSQYRDERSEEHADYDGTAAEIFHPDWRVNDRTFTQELNLTSNPGADRLSWVLGLYYYNNRNEYPYFRASVGGAPAAKIFDSEIINESFAGFADVTYEVMDRLFLTGGLRYSIDKVDGYYFVDGGPTDRNDETYRKLTPRVNIRYELDDYSSVYASYNKGYKAGFLPVSAFDVRSSIEPEEIDAFEVGYKTARGAFMLDLSAFYYDYANLQVASYIGVSSIYTNAGQSEIYGLDAQLTADVAENFQVFVGGTYTHAEYESYPNAVLYVQDPASGLFNTISTDAGGNVMQRSPKFTGNIGLHYSYPMESGNLSFDANYYYTSKFYFDPNKQFGQGSYGLLNLRATYATPDERWAFSVYGTNVTDEKYINQVLPGTFAIQQTWGEPAVYGASVTFRY